MNDEVLTPAQDDAVKKAYSLLHEHFDSALIVVAAEIEEQGQRADANQMFWSGGYCNAIGLAEYAKYKLLMNSDLREQEFEP